MEISILLQLIFAALLGTAGSVIAQKYIETHATLIVALCITGMVIIGGHGIYRIYSKDIFKVTSIILVRLKWPGPLVFCYPSASGKNLSPISVALFVEVVNNNDVISRIYSYECRALLEYDEGGSRVVNRTPNGGIKLEYKPAGKTVSKWRNLYNMGFVDDQVYFITGHDWRKCKRIDFRNNGFDRQARDTQLNPGESLKGWMFFELEHDLRGQLPEIKKIKLTLTNSAGESQSFKIKQNAKDDNDMVHFISSGEWNVLEGFYDLTKEKYTMTPMVDLRRILKTGKSITVNP
jgi:hypothetical protein